MAWAAVIGSPIDHSLSPVLHRAAWDSLGKDPQWSYRRIEARAEDLPAVVASLDEDCIGLSITMPCKRAIIEYLDALDPVAHAVGAVNTLVPAAGVFTGFNTDVHGIVEALKEALVPAGMTPRSGVVLGSGATAASALAALGTLGVTDFTVAARNFAGPESILAAAGRLGVDVRQVMWADEAGVVAAMSTADVVVSTLPAGVTDTLAPQVKAHEGQAFLDVVYAPRRTALLDAFDRGAAVIAYGLDMLVHQAAMQVRLMTGADPDVAAMKASVQQWR